MGPCSADPWSPEFQAPLWDSNPGPPPYHACAAGERRGLEGTVEPFPAVQGAPDSPPFPCSTHHNSPPWSKP